MTLTLALIGSGFFLIIFLFLILLLPRPSAESALLKEVTRQPRIGVEGGGPQSGVGGLDVDRLAKPFSFLRGLFAGEPNPDLIRKLSFAGYRKTGHADMFVVSRVALPAFLSLGVALLAPDNILMYFFLALALGFFAPDFWLARAITKRREHIRLSLPDGIDLLAICIEAGLSLDQAMLRVGQELRLSHPDLSDELLQVNFEQRAGVPRVDAWKGFADRVDLENVRSFVAMLIQTDRFGTPVSKSLGNFSDALRVQRRQKAEEMAAKTTIKLVLPLVLLIFPEVFIVVVAPAILTLIRSMAHIVG